MERFAEVDAVRGIAIVMMVVFHFFWDLDFLGIVQNEMYAGGWLVFQRITISLFLLLVGVSLRLSYSKMKEKNARAMIEKFGKRSVKIFAVAALISIVTWVAVPNAWIVFGVIHFIALATLVAVPFLRFRIFNAAAGLVLLAQGVWLPLPQIDRPWLLWLGFSYPGFYSVDYVPLLPWFGLVLIGIFLGKTFYPDGKRTFRWKARIPLLPWLGRHSLAAYLIHQPVLLSLLQTAVLLL